jgi:transcriptional regulator NrdR family protein
MVLLILVDVMSSIIVKRKNKKQKFDERKVYASAYAAAMNAHLSEKESEKIADDVCKKIDSWLKGKHTITSEELSKKITKLLEKHNMDAAFLYETHLDLS